MVAPIVQRETESGNKLAHKYNRGFLPIRSPRNPLTMYAIITMKVVSKKMIDTENWGRALISAIYFSNNPMNKPEKP